MSRRNYLSTKSYHPASQQNRARVWAAEQEAERRAALEAERQAVLAKERPALVMTPACDESSGTMEARESVSFLYRAPPGFYRDRDAEARADRQRKLEDPSLLTLKDKFPEIKNAPTKSAVSKSMDLRVQMLGKVLRNVQCSKCHAWGHKSGERECPLKDVLAATDMERRDREDPMRHFAPSSSLPAGPGLILKEEIIVRGGGDASSENHQLVSASADIPERSDHDSDDPETTFLRGLTPEERTNLLRKLRKKERKRKRSKHESSSRHKRRRSSRSPPPATLENPL